ncbi:MAG: M14 family zinc carboxypeptidase [Bacteroidales bacterium]
MDSTRFCIRFAGIRVRSWSTRVFRWFLIFVVWIPPAVSAQVQLKYEQNRTVTWQEAIEMYSWLDRQYEEARLIEAGLSDAGKPLHLFIISRSGVFDPDSVRAAGKTILFINNGIHPGEPCGVDASLKLAEGLLSGKDPYAGQLEHTVVAIVPMLNVGGALNRGSYFRANQAGPVEHGFRGNARNLDLNRDFIKLDSRNTRSLVSLLRKWEPDVFVDTHTSNGADYPYAITLINSHQQRHEKVQGKFLDSTMLPALYDAMRNTPYEMIPYVWSYRDTPESGIVGFMDYPRYTSGYASLFNTLAFTVETHMLKPFEDRVLSTWYLLREMLKFCSTHRDRIIEVKKQALREKLEKNTFVLRWKQDTTRYEPLPFRGYSAKRKPSQITGHPRLYYDHNARWQKEIPYYRYFRPSVTVEPPDYYVLPVAWHEVAERLRLNHVQMEELTRDTVLEVEVYYIEETSTTREPYNGHYWHPDTRVRKEKQRIRFLAGSYLIPVRQQAIEYLVQTLEPQGYDSFFSWNFFDAVLSRKEYFSPYVFEETARRLLEEDPALRREFESLRSGDSLFRANPYLQLRYIYERSPWSEPTYRRYPVCRWSP